VSFLLIPNQGLVFSPTLTPHFASRPGTWCFRLDHIFDITCTSLVFPNPIPHAASFFPFSLSARIVLIPSGGLFEVSFFVTVHRSVLSEPTTFSLLSVHTQPSPTRPNSCVRLRSKLPPSNSSQSLCLRLPREVTLLHHITRWVQVEKSPNSS